MKFCLAALFLLSPLIAGDPALFYCKKFPGSKPAYSEIRLTRDGKVEYRETPDEDPLRFKLTESEADAVFQLAEKLDKMKRELESGLKVARMGDKTIRWEQDGVRNEVTFNYSTDLDAQALHDWFEKMSESGQYYYELEKSVKFDKLGVNQAILKLESAWDKKHIVGVAMYLPLLDRVAKNDTYLNMARDRAEKLAALFRETAAPKAKVE
jgi:hypothetical protein